MQAEWRSWTYGRAPNAIDISYGSLTCPWKDRHGANLFIRLFRKTAQLEAFYDTLSIRRIYSRLNPRVPTRQNRENTEGYSRWKVEKRHSKVSILFEYPGMSICLLWYLWSLHLSIASVFHYADMSPLEDIIVEVPEDNSSVTISWQTDHNDGNGTYAVYWCPSNTSRLKCTVSVSVLVIKGWTTTFKPFWSYL